MAFPGREGAKAIDAAGLASLSVLRAMGLPALMPVALLPHAADLKDRAQAKKAVAAALAVEVRLGNT